ncbi:YceK/YidQ family lipoprotein [Agaribacterium sp. ZY112]|uniref:YceK/YidQ family lipoprotein n=1 Tax=Agaribacterium sp. ZY112 TaxID=3233574 RepID=UPI0035259FBC
MKKGLFIILALSSLCACGTYTSLSSTDRQIARKLDKKNTHCDSVSRLYGGVSYNLCSLHSSPNKSYYINVWASGFYLVDTAFSAVSDTVVIPYSAYRQINDGNVEVN